MRDSRAMEAARRWYFLPEWTLVSARGATAMAVAAAFGVALLALITRNLLGHQPTYDELLHILSARGLLATGEPVIGDGIYERAQLYTQAVALAFSSLGDSLVAARIPAWLSALALVALTGAWVTRRAGFVAGCAAGALLAISPWTIDLAVFSRFYTLHALAIMIMFMGLYEAFARDRRPAVRGIFVILAAATAGIAWHLQVTTIIAIGACAAGVLAVLALDNGHQLVGLGRRRALLVFSAIVIVALLATWVMIELGLMKRLGTVPLWAQSRANAREYYNSALAHDLPLLWPLLPFAFIAALYVDRRLAVFSAAVAAAALIVHSIAAQKATRYVYYIMPLLCVVWACAIPKCAALLASVLSRVGPPAARVAVPVAFAMIAVTVVNSTEGRRAARLLAARDGVEVLSYAGEADWTKAVPMLRNLRAEVSSLVASNSMKALYFLGDYDAELDASTVEETDTGEDFGVDPRTGRPIVSRPESIGRLLDKPGGTLVIVEQEKLGKPVGVTEEVVAVLDSRCSRAELPREGGVVAWSCQAGATAPEPLAHR